jgi:hypothetical protein
MSLEEPCEISGDSAERSAGAAENSRCLRPVGPSFGNSNPAAGGKRPRTGRRFHTASERDIPHDKDQCLIPHFDETLGRLPYPILSREPLL